MSSPFYRKRGQDWHDVVNAYAALRDNLAVYFRGRGMPQDRFDEVMMCFYDTLEGNSPLAKAFVEYLTEDEQVWRNMFTGEAVRE